ncbi:MAG: bifunctional diaminohydroxyphosphoribosylaminopyrimidine deaminase/5-amino-6-(5-phosphoribosylamino)uracil reductase RibD [Acidimicrobiia bacterium]
MGASPHLERAYELARPHRTHPNPKVGAVVVSRDGVVVGEGAHQGPGRPHAEAKALDRVVDPQGSTLYVSLEPCTHHGRTPPCVDRVIAAGVARVVIGALDPDERVAGAGVARLLEAGVEVDVVDDPEARALDPGYFRHRETGLPLVIVKYAMTIDGAVAARDGTSQWITSEPARADAHRLRADADGVVVGAGTLVADDPRLDVRVDDYVGEQPRAIVIAGATPIPPTARLWERDPLIVSNRPREIPAGELLVVDGGDRPDPMAVCRALADAGFLSLLLEGGPTLIGAWWRAGVIGRGVVYLGATLGGGAGMPPLGGVFSSIDDARAVVVTHAERVGPDVRLDFESGF